MDFTRLASFYDERALTALADPDQVVMDPGQCQKCRDRRFFSADTTVREHQNCATGIDCLLGFDEKFLQAPLKSLGALLRGEASVQRGPTETINVAMA